MLGCSAHTGGRGQAGVRADSLLCSPLSPLDIQVAQEPQSRWLPAQPGVCFLLCPPALSSCGAAAFTGDRSSGALGSSSPALQTSGCQVPCLLPVPGGQGHIPQLH